jgi:hypothetical protein
MRPEIKDAFEKAAAGHAARETQRATEEKQRSKGEQFAVEWDDKREQVIFPAFEQIRDMLMPRGWTCKIRTDPPEGAAVLEIYKGETRTASGSIKTPAITFTPNAHSQEVVIHAAAMYHGRGEGNVPLREITADFVQAQVLKFFERLVREG